MAYLDDEDEEALNRLAEEGIGAPGVFDDEPEEPETARSTGPTERSRVINEAEDVLGDLDLSAVDSLGENAAGATRSAVVREVDDAPLNSPPPNPFDEPLRDSPPTVPEDGAFDGGPRDPMDAWSEAGNDPEEDPFAAYEALGEAPPDDPAAMASFDAGEPTEAPGATDDLGTLGAAMDHDPSETTASLDLDDAPGGLDEPYPETESEGPVSLDPTAMIMPMSDPAFRASAYDPLVLGRGPEDGPALDEGRPALDDTSMDDLDYTGSEAFPPGHGTYAADEDMELSGSEMFPTGMGGPGRSRAMVAMDEADLRDPFMGYDDDATFAGHSRAAEEGAGGLADPSMPEDDYPSLEEEQGLEERSAELGKVPSGTTGPPEPDFTGADWSDAIRRPLHAIGAGLLASSGRGTASPFRSERTAMEERLAARDAAKAGATETHTGAMTARDEMRSRLEERSADRASREGIAAETAEERGRHNREMERLGGRRADTGDVRAGAYVGEADSRTAVREAELLREDERNDPESDASARAMERLPAYTAGLPPDLRPEVEAYLSERSWSAADVERFERFSPQMWRSRLGRRGGGVGGGGGRDELRAAFERAGLNPDDVDALGTREARRLLTGELDEGSAPAEEAAAENDYLVPGVPMSLVSPRVGMVEARNLSESVGILRNGTAALDALDRLAREHGASAIIDPEVWAEMEPHISRMLNVVSRVRNIGIIQVGEMPGVRGSLPDPSSVTGMTLGSYAGALRGWREVLDDDVATNIGRVTNENEDAIDAALNWLHSSPRRHRGGGGARGGAGGGGTVEMRDSDGVAYDVPAAEVEAAEADGLVRAR